MQLILLFMILESCVSLSSYRLLALAGLPLLVKGPELGQGSGDSAGQQKVRRRQRQGSRVVQQEHNPRTAQS